MTINVQYQFIHSLSFGQNYSLYKKKKSKLAQNYIKNFKIKMNKKKSPCHKKDCFLFMPIKIETNFFQNQKFRSVFTTRTNVVL